MKSSSAATATLLLAFALLAAPGGVAAAESAAKAPPAEKAEPAAKDPATKARPVLEKGMADDLILKNFGPPYDIKPMDAPDKATKAERWIYRRKVKETTSQVPVGYTTITPPNVVVDNNGTAGSAYIPTTTLAEYKLRTTTVYQVTELLMINGRLELAKQWMGQEEKYQ